jgi:hypothetical protein
MTVRVKVIPRSARTEVAGELADGTLKVKIAAPRKGSGQRRLVPLPGGQLRRGPERGDHRERPHGGIKAGAHRAVAVGTGHRFLWPVIVRSKGAAERQATKNDRLSHECGINSPVRDDGTRGTIRAASAEGLAAEGDLSDPPLDRRRDRPLRRGDQCQRQRSFLPQYRQ